MKILWFIVGVIVGVLGSFLYRLWGVPVLPIEREVTGQFSINDHLDNFVNQKLVRSLAKTQPIKVDRNGYVT